jgi:hypothetical protein
MRNLYSGLLPGASFLAAERRAIHLRLSFHTLGIVDIMQHVEINRVNGIILSLRLF